MVYSEWLLYTSLVIYDGIKLGPVKVVLKHGILLCFSWLQIYTYVCLLQWQIQYPWLGEVH